MVSVFPPSLFVNVTNCAEVEFASKKFNFWNFNILIFSVENVERISDYFLQ